MKLTTRSEYALLALLYLSRHYSEEYNTVETVAASQSIPHKYLEQIMLALKRERATRRLPAGETRRGHNVGRNRTPLRRRARAHRLR